VTCFEDFRSGLESSSVSIFKAIFKNYLNNDNYDHSVLLADLAKFSAYASDSIEFEIQRLQHFAQVRLVSRVETSTTASRFFGLFHKDEGKRHVRDNASVERDTKRERRCQGDAEEDQSLCANERTQVSQSEQVNTRIDRRVHSELLQVVQALARIVPERVDAQHLLDERLDKHSKARRAVVSSVR
jgi:hypothetical protein